MQSSTTDYCTLWSIVSKLTESNAVLDDAHNLSKQLDGYFDVMVNVNPFILKPQSAQDK